MSRSFNGSTDYLDTGADAAYDYERTQALSMAAWIYPTANAYGPILTKWLAGAPPGFDLSIIGGTSSPRLRVAIANTWDTNAISQRSADSSIPLNVWTHIAGTYDGSSTAAGTKIYINGERITESTEFDTLSASILSNSTVKIGGNTAQTLTGRLAEVGLYNVELTANEVRQVMYAGRVYRGLTGYWPLWGAGSPEPDLSGNSNNGAVTGATQAAGPPLGRYSGPRHRPLSIWTEAFPSSSIERAMTDGLPMADAFATQFLRHRQQADAFPMADAFLTSVEYQPTTTANKPKLIARPRWLFDANIGGTRKYSSEDMEKP